MIQTVYKILSYCNTAEYKMREVRFLWLLLMTVAVLVGSTEEASDEYEEEDEDWCPEGLDCRVEFCLEDIDYENSMPDCSDVIRGTNQTIPGTGCTRFFHCGETAEVYQCPENFYFDGRECSPQYVCPKPCRNVPQDEETIAALVHSGTAMFASGLARWPVQLTNCKVFTEWTYDNHGGISGTSQRCPELSWFDPHQLRCRVRYLCEEQPSSAISCPDGVDHGYCDPEFPVPRCADQQAVAVADSGCHYFAACGVSGKRILRCPAGTLFDPAARECTAGHRCSRPCRAYPEQGFLPGAVASGPPPRCPTAPLSRPVRLAVPGAHCARFLECAWHLGVAGSLHECPRFSWFDPSLSRCSSNHKCQETCVPKDPKLFEPRYNTSGKTLDLHRPSPSANRNDSSHPQRGYKTVGNSKLENNHGALKGNHHSPSNNSPPRFNKVLKNSDMRVIISSNMNKTIRGKQKDNNSKTPINTNEKTHSCEKNKNENSGSTKKNEHSSNGNIGAKKVYKENNKNTTWKNNLTKKPLVKLPAYAENNKNDKQSSGRPNSMLEMENPKNAENKNHVKDSKVYASILNSRPTISEDIDLQLSDDDVNQEDQSVSSDKENKYPVDMTLLEHSRTDVGKLVHENVQSNEHAIKKHPGGVYPQQPKNKNIKVSPNSRDDTSQYINDKFKSNRYDDIHKPKNMEINLLENSKDDVGEYVDGTDEYVDGTVSLSGKGGNSINKNSHEQKQIDMEFLGNSRDDLGHYFKDVIKSGGYNEYSKNKNPAASFSYQPKYMDEKVLKASPDDVGQFTMDMALSKDKHAQNVNQREPETHTDATDSILLSSEDDVGQRRYIGSKFGQIAEFLVPPAYTGPAEPYIAGYFLAPAGEERDRSTWLNSYKTHPRKRQVNEDPHYSEYFKPEYSYELSNNYPVIRDETISSVKEDVQGISKSESGDHGSDHSLNEDQKYSTPKDSEKQSFHSNDGSLVSKGNFDPFLVDLSEEDLGQKSEYADGMEPNASKDIEIRRKFVKSAPEKNDESDLLLLLPSEDDVGQYDAEIDHEESDNADQDETKYHVPFNSENYTPFFSSEDDVGQYDAEANAENGEVDYSAFLSNPSEDDVGQIDENSATNENYNNPFFKNPPNQLQNSNKNYEQQSNVNFESFLATPSEDDVGQYYVEDNYRVPSENKNSFYEPNSHTNYAQQSNLNFEPFLATPSEDDVGQYYVEDNYRVPLKNKNEDINTFYENNEKYTGPNQQPNSNTNYAQQSNVNFEPFLALPSEDDVGQYYVEDKNIFHEEHEKYNIQNQQSDSNKNYYAQQSNENFEPFLATPSEDDVGQYYEEDVYGTPANNKYKNIIYRDHGKFIQPPTHNMYAQNKNNNFDAFLAEPSEDDVGQYHEEDDSSNASNNKLKHVIYADSNEKYAQGKNINFESFLAEPSEDDVGQYSEESSYNMPPNNKHDGIQKTYEDHDKYIPQNQPQRSDIIPASYNNLHLQPYLARPSEDDVGQYYGENGDYTQSNLPGSHTKNRAQYLDTKYHPSRPSEDDVGYYDHEIDSQRSIDNKNRVQHKLHIARPSEDDVGYIHPESDRRKGLNNVRTQYNEGAQHDNVKLQHFLPRPSADDVGYYNQETYPPRQFTQRESQYKHRAPLGKGRSEDTNRDQMFSIPSDDEVEQPYDVEMEEGKDNLQKNTNYFIGMKPEPISRNPSEDDVEPLYKDYIPAMDDEQDNFHKKNNFFIGMKPEPISLNPSEEDTELSYKDYISAMDDEQDNLQMKKKYISEMKSDPIYVYSFGDDTKSLDKDDFLELDRSRQANNKQYFDAYNKRYQDKFKLDPLFWAPPESKTDRLDPGSSESNTAQVVTQGKKEVDQKVKPNLINKLFRTLENAAINNESRTNQSSELSDNNPNFHIPYEDDPEQILIQETEPQNNITSNTGMQSIESATDDLEKDNPEISLPYISEDDLQPGEDDYWPTITNKPRKPIKPETTKPPTKTSTNKPHPTSTNAPHITSTSAPYEANTASSIIPGQPIVNNYPDNNSPLKTSLNTAAFAQHNAPGFGLGGVMSQAELSYQRPGQFESLGRPENLDQSENLGQPVVLGQPDVPGQPCDVTDPTSPCFTPVPSMNVADYVSKNRPGISQQLLPPANEPPIGYNFCDPREPSCTSSLAPESILQIHTADAIGQSFAQTNYNPNLITSANSQETMGQPAANTNAQDNTNFNINPISTSNTNSGYNTNNPDSLLAMPTNPQVTVGQDAQNTNYNPNTILASLAEHDVGLRPTETNCDVNDPNCLSDTGRRTPNFNTASVVVGQTASWPSPAGVGRGVPDPAAPEFRLGKGGGGASTTRGMDGRASSKPGGSSGAPNKGGGKGDGKGKGGGKDGGKGGGDNKNKFSMVSRKVQQLNFQRFWNNIVNPMGFRVGYGNPAPHYPYNNFFGRPFGNPMFSKMVSSKKLVLNDTKVGNNSVIRRTGVADCILASKIYLPCFGEGNFPVIYSECKHYVKCRYGPMFPFWMMRRELRCPGNETFDPQLALCSANYTCKEARPCQVVSFSLRQNLETTYDENDPTFIKCLNGKKIELPSCSSNSKSVQEIKGAGCRQYYMCVPGRDMPTWEIVTCRVNTLFNPSSKQCEEGHSCKDEDVCFT